MLVLFLVLNHPTCFSAWDSSINFQVVHDPFELSGNKPVPRCLEAEFSVLQYFSAVSVHPH